MKIVKGVAIERRERRDLETTYEEAYVIIPRQVVDAATQGSKCIKVICDDTDVFILLIHYYQQCSLTCIVLMEGTSRMRAVTDIGATAKQHAYIAGQFLAAHALTGCDTVAFMWGLRTAKTVKLLLSGCKLLKMGNTDMPMDEVLPKYVCNQIRGIDCQDIKEESDWRAKTETPTDSTRSLRAKCEAGTFPSICMESSIRKRPSWTCTNKLWLGKGRSFEIAGTSHNIRRRCSCIYGCTQRNHVQLCNRPAMRNCQVHVWNC